MKKRIHWRIDAAGVVFCIAASAGVYFGGMSPLIQQHAALEQQQGDLANQQRRASQLASSTALLKKELQSVRQRLAKTKITLRPIKHLNRQIVSLTELVNKCGLKTNSIQLGKIHKSSKYNIVPIDLAGVGKFKTSALFLHRLSEGFPDTGISGFKISGNTQHPGTPGTFRFQLFWYAASIAGEKQE